MRPRHLSSIRRCLPCAAALLALPAAALAQEPADRGLRLDDAVATAFHRSWSLQGARRDIDAAEAEVLGARAAYDTRVATSVTGARNERSALDADGTVAPDALSVRASTYELRLARELPGGIVLRPGVSISRVDDPASAPMSVGQAGARVAATVPLGFNRGGGVTRSALRAAEIGRDATAHEIRQAASAGIRDVVGAYWEYRAATERLEVHRSSEARAARLVEETRTLVAAEERPAADLIQLEANLASKRITRIGAEQAEAAARQQLGLLMGLDASSAAALPLPAEPFPEPVSFAAGREAVRHLLELAGRNRTEVAAAELRLEAARLREGAARTMGRPALDLTVEVGYTGLTTDSGLGAVFSPFYRDVPGPSLSVQLTYEAAPANHRARGEQLRQAGLADQLRLSTEATRERVASNVILAAASLERAVLVLADAERALRLFATAVDNEKAKYGLGTATLFDVIQAENNLTSAQLSAVEGALGHAAALSRLRWETGTLVRFDGQEIGFSAEMATTHP